MQMFFGIKHGSIGHLFTTQITHYLMNYQSNTLKQTILVGIFFLLLVTTYISFSNIITFIFEHNSQQFPFVGGLSLILNYAVYLVGLTYAASLKNFKRQFQIAAIAYTINYALYIVDVSQLVRLIVSIIGAMIGGYGASVLWVSQGGYMVKLFRKYNISGSDQGWYMGIQNGIIYGQVIMGGIITTFALGLFGNQIYFTVLTVIGIISFLFCRCFIDPLDDPPGHAEVYEEVSEQVRFMHELKKVIRFYPLMKHIVPAMILDGIMLAFTTTNFSSFLPKPLQNDYNIGLLHISNGVGAIIGAYLSGYLSSKIAVIKEGIILFVLTIFTLLITILIQFYTFEGMTFALVTTFLWGICLFFLEGWLFVACVRMFRGIIESFAVVKQMHTISFIVFQIYSLLSGQKVNFFWTIIAILALTVLCLILCIYVNRKLGQHEEMVEQSCEQDLDEDSPPQERLQ